MAAPNPRLAELSDDDRQIVESWLIAFDQGWDEAILVSRVEQIPIGSSWRVPALVEMVKIDLERQWQHGRRVSLESYLEQYPELGRPEDVSADLIQAEFEVRRQFGAPAALEDYLRRFPHQAAELARLIDRGDSSLPGNGPRRTSALLPTTFGRYTIIKRLGQGGMGSVYLAQDAQLGRPVALKVPHFGHHEAPEARKRFLVEARAAATLEHPSLCRVFEAGEIDGRLYLTMAYIEGRSLAALIGAEGWPQDEAAGLVSKLALAMQEAHTKQVIHRDLKPANVMIKTTGQRREPVIVDFGLAHRNNPEAQRLTRSGQVMGTPAYMAPEQVRGDLDEIGPASDIYALGVILYELLAGQRPFGGSAAVVAGEILTGTPLPPSAHRRGLDPALEAICLKAMAKQPGDRYSSMGELAAALTGFLVPTSEPVASPQPTQERRRPQWIGLSVAIGVLLTGSLVAWRGGVLKVKTPGGVFVSKNVPQDSPISADGGKINVKLAVPTPPANRIPPAGPARRPGVVHGSLWFVEADQLIKDGLGDGWVTFGDQGWSDYDFTYEARKSAGPEGLGGPFRSVKGKTFLLNLGGSDQVQAVGLWPKPLDKNRGRRQVPGTIRPLQWYKVKISVRGQHIRVDLDDQVLFDFMDNHSLKGQVGLRCYNCAGRFRNIKVAAPDGTVLWEGPPDLPEK